MQHLARFLRAQRRATQGDGWTTIRWRGLASSPAVTPDTIRFAVFLSTARQRACVGASITQQRWTLWVWAVACWCLRRAYRCCAVAAGWSGGGALLHLSYGPSHGPPSYLAGLVVVTMRPRCGFIPCRACHSLTAYAPLPPSGRRPREAVYLLHPPSIAPTCYSLLTSSFAASPLGASAPGAKGYVAASRSLSYT